MKRVLDERLLRRVERLLPKSPPRPKGGRPRAIERACLEGILYSLRTGCPWEYLPKDLGVSGMTCWRRLRDRHEAGVWAGFHRALLDALGREGLLDCSSASVDSASLGAKRGGQDTGPRPVDRGKPGTKRHLIVDAKGLPLAAMLSGANRHESLFLLPLLDAIPSVASRRGPRRRRPAKLHADKAYEHRKLRRAV